MAMDLDTALNELGMLSIVTESRRDFLKERATHPHSQNGSSPACASQPQPSFHIIKMNTQYVTCVGSVLPSHHASPHKLLSDGATRNGIVEAPKSLSASRSHPSFLTNEHRVARSQRPLRRHHQRKPYAIPHAHRPRSSRSRRNKLYLSTSLEDDVFVDDLGTDCNGNGRKYRSPSSEAAEMASCSAPVLKLHRSRSLDDLHLERLRIDDGLSRHRSDVELASKLISNLQVS